MTRRLTAAAIAGLLLVTLPSAARAGGGGNYGKSADLGRQVLPANDGWAAAGPGTTGGSAADDAHVFTVRTRAELVAAIGGRANAVPKIIYVDGHIDGFEAADGTLLDCAALADPAYSLDAYLAAYDPATWGYVAPAGELEAARVRSVARQTAQTQINLSPNTTLVGRPGATLSGLTLMVDGASNTIIRNLAIEDARDCFPAWSPTDGEFGNWNSNYDLISVRRSENVWVDHNTFSDGDNLDADQPIYFGRPYQVHDGALDITHTASLVTASWNVFTDHDKTMLIGSSNTVGPDVGRLRVTIHHNLFDGSVQRLPRVRFGQVDIYNNHYRLSGETFDYAWGVGVQSAIYAENNYFRLYDDLRPDAIIHDWGGTAITERGTVIRIGNRAEAAISVLDAYNATHDPDLSGDAGWTPVLRAGPVLPATDVPSVVGSSAGAGRL
ncbi:pectate lyase family protein [Catenuloplanes atrovinosus]|uniref:Pectate lyase n=1 Tax=Catenuloplanes atrovinosus TaxID=137266 RepID=A0AAE4CD83_9ACTN|nr:pectate lyase [Catenuloplanes atrovinosus]MDR7280361.1 pectate lyase [Catenuloplanes atrovinosus]